MGKYVAIHYIPTKKGLLSPGEIVSDLPEDVLSRLLEKGAIKQIASDSPAEEVTPEEAAPEAAPAEEDIEEAEIDDDAEAPEIDALDGICDAEPEEAPKPAKKRGRGKKGA